MSLAAGARLISISVAQSRGLSAATKVAGMTTGFATGLDCAATSGLIAWAVCEYAKEGFRGSTYVQAAAGDLATWRFAPGTAFRYGYSGAGGIGRDQSRRAAVHERHPASGLVSQCPDRSARATRVAVRHSSGRRAGGYHAFRRFHEYPAGLRNRLDLDRPQSAWQRPEYHHQVSDAQACLRQLGHGPGAVENGGQQPALATRHREAGCRA